MADDPLTIAQAAARGFQLLECEQCARAVRSALQAAGFGGTWIELRVGSGRDFMVCLSYDGGQTPITENGRHVGVRVAERVVDNLHPAGVPFDDWLADFDAPGGVVVRRTEDF